MTVVAILDPENYGSVQERIKAAWSLGEVEFSPHILDQGWERGLDVLDIQHVIRFGRITDHEQERDLWRFEMEGKSVDGNRMRVVIDLNGRTILVTAFYL